MRNGYREFNISLSPEGKELNVGRMAKIYEPEYVCEEERERQTDEEKEAKRVIKTT